MEIIVYSTIAGLATVIGAAIACLSYKYSERMLSLFLGMAAGIMLGVVAFDLLPSAWNTGGFTATVWGFVVGMLVLFFLDRIFSALIGNGGPDKGHRRFLSIGYLIALGIALHNLPEGIAVAAGFSATFQLGWMIVLALGFHNIPEGMASAVPLRLGGVSTAKILGLNALVSLFTPLGTVLGLLFVELAQDPVGFLLALAAGAMAYIVSFELVPELRNYQSGQGYGGMAGGFILILIITLFFS